MTNDNNQPKSPNEPEDTKPPLWSNFMVVSTDVVPANTLARGQMAIVDGEPHDPNNLFLMRRKQAHGDYIVVEYFGIGEDDLPGETEVRKVMFYEELQ